MRIVVKKITEREVEIQVDERTVATAFKAHSEPVTVVDLTKRNTSSRTRR